MSLISVRDTQLNCETIPSMWHKDVVFVHGNLAANPWWYPTLEHWQENGEKSLHLYEWRGCGRSCPPNDEAQLDIKELAKDLVEVIKVKGTGRVQAVGHSTGGLILLAAMIQEPEVFERVVFLDSVGAKGIRLSQQMLDAFEQMKVSRDVCEQAMAATIKDVDTQSSTFQEIVDLAFNVAPLNWTGVPKALANIDLSDSLAQLSQKCLVLHGSEDPILPIEDSINLAELLPNGRFEPLVGAGHSFNMEQPKTFCSKLKEFLS